MHQALDEGIKDSNKDIKAVISVFVSRLDRLAGSGVGCIKGIRTPTIRNCHMQQSAAHEVNNVLEIQILELCLQALELEEMELVCYYIDTLIYPNSVNTAPLVTIKDC